MSNEMAICLNDSTAFSTIGTPAGELKAEQVLYGTWMHDGNFYYPMSQHDGSTAVCLATLATFAPYQKETPK